MSGRAPFSLRVLCEYGPLHLATGNQFFVILTGNVSLNTIPLALDLGEGPHLNLNLQLIYMSSLPSIANCDVKQSAFIDCKMCSSIQMAIA